MTFLLVMIYLLPSPIRLMTNAINISSLLDMEQIIQENDLNEMFFFSLLFHTIHRQTKLLLHFLLQ